MLLKISIMYDKYFLKRFKMHLIFSVCNLNSPSFCFGDVLMLSCTVNVQSFQFSSELSLDRTIYQYSKYPLLWILLMDMSF